jgi:hypothetical protein
MPKYTPRVLGRVYSMTCLRELDLTARPNGGVVGQEIGETLKSLPGLRVLKVWMDFSNDGVHYKVYDAIREYRDMVMNVLGLEELGVICSTKGRELFLLVSKIT